MKASANSVKELCHSRYEEIISHHHSEDGATEYTCCFGELTQEYVNQISAEIEERMFEDGERKPVVKRMFSIIVEGLQNIRLHGERDLEGNQTSFFIIMRNEDHYFIYLGNLILNVIQPRIIERIDQVNSMDPAEIKELYLSVLTNGIISSKGGAGLGFITMSMKSGNQLQGAFVPIDDRIMHYDLKVTLDRN